jgi:uncharacterized protein YegP (UPF0339 family)
MKAIVVFAILCLAVAASATNAHRRVVARKSMVPPAAQSATPPVPPPAPDSKLEKSIEKQWPNFELKPTTNGQFHVVLKAGNAETIVSSETLKQKGSARKTCFAILRAAFNPKAIETKKSADGKFMFNLKGGNGEIVGTSETYKDDAGLKKGIAAVTKASIGFLLKFVRAAEANKEPKKPSVKHFPATGDNEKGKFYAHVKAANGEVILYTGKASDTADAALENLAEVLGHALSSKNAKWEDVEHKESNGKQGFRGKLLNAEGKEIARSEVYTDKAGLKRFKEETLPKNLRELFKTYWKNVVVQKELQDDSTDDSGSADAQAATSAAPSAPPAPQQSSTDE